MRFFVNLITIATLVAALTLAGCSSLPQALSGQYPNSADAYTPGQSQQMQQVQLGTVISVRSVRIAATQGQATTGSVIGAAVGGLLGHSVGGGKGKTIATVAGALAGTVGGNLAAQHAYAQPGLAITVRLDNGSVYAVSQAADVSIHVGERVQLQGGGWNEPARVVPLS